MESDSQFRRVLRRPSPGQRRRALLGTDRQTLWPESELVSDVVDPTFRFMTLDWDGRIRIDPSSKYAMQSLIALKDKFDVPVACDTDHDRHGT